MDRVYLCMWNCGCVPCVGTRKGKDKNKRQQIITTLKHYRINLYIHVHWLPLVFLLGVSPFFVVASLLLWTERGIQMNTPMQMKQ